MVDFEDPQVDSVKNVRAAAAIRMCHVCKYFGCIQRTAKTPRNSFKGPRAKPRMASTLDPRDAGFLLSEGSCHYMNVHEDSGWFGTDESPQAGVWALYGHVRRYNALLAGVPADLACGTMAYPAD